MNFVKPSSTLILFLFSLVFIFSSCEEEGGESNRVNYPRPTIEWIDPVEIDEVVYTDEQIVLQASRDGGPVQELEWKVNGTLVTSAEQVILNEDTTVISLSYPFEQEGVYDVTLRVANEAGEDNLLQTLTVLDRPIPTEILLAGETSKKWRFTSIKLDGTGGELIEEFEKDNTLEFFRNNQSAGGGSYNVVFDIGSTQEGQTNDFGRWEFFGTGAIRFTSIDLFPTFATIVSIEQNKLVLSKRVGGADLVYELVLVD